MSTQIPPLTAAADLPLSAPTHQLPKTPFSTANNLLLKKKSFLTHPKFKMIAGALVLLFVLVGAAAGFYLSGQNQDNRQQAWVSEGAGTGAPGDTGSGSNIGDDAGAVFPGSETNDGIQGSAASCGDKICQQNENSSNCPSDCQYGDGTAQSGTSVNCCKESQNTKAESDKACEKAGGIPGKCSTISSKPTDPYSNCTPQQLVSINCKTGTQPSCIAGKLNSLHCVTVKADLKPSPVPTGSCSAALGAERACMSGSRCKLVSLDPERYEWVKDAGCLVSGVNLITVCPEGSYDNSQGCTCKKITNESYSFGYISTLPEDCFKSAQADSTCGALGELPCSGHGIAASSAQSCETGLVVGYLDQQVYDEAYGTMINLVGCMVDPSDPKSLIKQSAPLKAPSQACTADSECQSRKCINVDSTRRVCAR